MTQYEWLNVFLFIVGIVVGVFTLLDVPRVPSARWQLAVGWGITIVCLLAVNYDLLFA